MEIGAVSEVVTGFADEIGREEAVKLEGVSGVVGIRLGFGVKRVDLESDSSFTDCKEPKLLFSFCKNPLPVVTFSVGTIGDGHWAPDGDANGAFGLQTFVVLIGGNKDDEG